MVVIYSAEILALVENMKNILKLHDIDADITNQHVSAGMGEIPPHECWPKLWVAEEDAGRARQVVEEAEKAPASLPAWTCPKCGEEVEGQFAACWNCGTVTD